MKNVARKALWIVLALNILTIVIAVTMPAKAQTIDEQLATAGRIINDQTKQINKLTDSHRELLKSHNDLMRYLFILACYQNKHIGNLNEFLGDWIKPFYLGDYVCPPYPDTATVVVPEFVEPMQ